MNEVRPLEEVKAGLEHCYTQDVCDGCPYVNIESSYCQSRLMRDANEHLKQLEDENAKLKAELEELRPLATEPIPEDTFPSDEEDFLSEEERCVGEYVGPDEAGL